MELMGNEIQCEFCGIWLHYDCIDCDENLNISSFLCPHCQVGSVSIFLKSCYNFYCFHLS